MANTWLTILKPACSYKATPTNAAAANTTSRWAANALRAYAKCYPCSAPKERRKQKNQQLQQRLRPLDERVAKRDATLRAQGLLDLLQSVEAMKNDMAKLRGQIEV